MKFTQEHEELRRTAKQFVDKEINPHVEQWEEEGIFPAHELFKKMGNLGLLGICKPVENGGMKKKNRRAPFQCQFDLFV